MAAQTTGYRTTSGSIFAMLFGAVAIVGVIGVAANTLIRGPMSSMADVTRRTVAENSMIGNSRLAIIMSGTQTTPDCDSDTMIEPLPYTNAGASPKPTGGGYLPTTMGASLTDPWGTQYGYCVWDHGSSIKVAGCGGVGALRLAGTNAKNYTSIAIISAGKDRAFQTSCAAFVNPATPLVNKPAGSDDIVISHTYAEMEAIGGDGIWRRKDATTADIDKDVEIRSAANAVTARIEKETGFGLFNSLYVDNIYKRTAARITVQDETMFNGNIGIGMIPGHRLDVNGNIRSIGTSPTIYMQDTDERGAAFHVNSNTFYLITTPANNPAFAANGSNWPLAVDLTTDSITLGGHVHIRDGGNLYTYNDTGWYNGTYGGGWYMLDTTWIRTFGNKGIYSANEFQGTLFRDANDNNYYVDPNGVSILNDIRPQIIYDLNNTGYYIDMNNASYVNQFTGNRADFDIYYDRNNAGYYVDPNGVSYVNHFTGNRGDFDILYDRNNTGYYVDMNNTSNIENLQANIFYDRYNTGYYMQPRATTNLNQVYVQDLRVNIMYDMHNTGYYWQGRATSSANVMYAYAYYYHSDARKKKNIVTIPPTDVTKLYDLRGVHFDWKESGKHDIGLIAQEVQKVFPELVSELKEGELGVQYGNLIPLLIEAAKAQKAEIEKQQSQIKELLDFKSSSEERIAKLEQKLNIIIGEGIPSPKSNVAPKPAPVAVPVPPLVVLPPSAPANDAEKLVVIPPVDMSKVPFAEDPSICPKEKPPACIFKQEISMDEEFSCRTEMTAYIHTSRIYNLCARKDKDAIAVFEKEYNQAMELAKAKKFDLGQTTLDKVTYSHVLALEHILRGSTLPQNNPPLLSNVPLNPASAEQGGAPTLPEVAVPDITPPSPAPQAPAQILNAPQPAEVVKEHENKQETVQEEEISPIVATQSHPVWLPVAGFGALGMIVIWLTFRIRKK